MDTTGVNEMKDSDTPTAPQGAEPAYRPALAALMDYKQADEDGVMVLVSRQAIHEVFDALTWHDQHAAPQGAEIARDAARYRWLRDQCSDDGCVIVMKSKHVNPALTNEQNIDAYIDAALTPTDAETK